MDIGVIGITPGFDRADDRNGGVVTEELVSPGSGGSMLHHVTYTDANGVTYKYLTDEMRLPAG